MVDQIRQQNTVAGRPVLRPIPGLIKMPTQWTPHKTARGWILMPIYMQSQHYNMKLEANAS
jgi:hypothetical protein